MSGTAIWRLTTLALCFAPSTTLLAQPRPIEATGTGDAKAQANASPDRYAFKIAATDGSSYAGRKIVLGGLDMDPLRAGQIGPVVTDRHFMFAAQTDQGPAIFLDDTVVADPTKPLQVIGKNGQLVSGTAIGFGQPVLNNSNVPDYAYTVTYKGAEAPQCPECRSSGLVVNGKLKLLYRSKLANCSSRADAYVNKVSSVYLNDSGSWMADVAMNDNARCWVKDGVVVAPVNGKIGDFPGYIQDGEAKFDQEGEFQFFAYRSPPLNGANSGPYLCTLAGCQPPPPGMIFGTRNNKGQSIYAKEGRLRRGDGGDYYNINIYDAPPPKYLLNNQGQIFTGHHLIDYADATKEMRERTPADLRRITIVTTEILARTLKIDVHRFSGVVSANAPFSMSNGGRVAFIVSGYYEVTDKGATQAHSAIIVGSPR